MNRITNLSDELSVRWFVERTPVSVCAAAGTRASFPPELRGAVRAGLVGVSLWIAPPELLGRVVRQRIGAGDCLVFRRAMLVGVIIPGERQAALPGQAAIDATTKRVQARRRRAAKDALLLLVRDALDRGGAASAPDSRPASPEENPYAVLGLAAGATHAEVKRAKLVLLRQYHPDKVATLGSKLQQLAEEESKRINRAADALEKTLTR